MVKGFFMKTLSFLELCLVSGGERGNIYTPGYFVSYAGWDLSNPSGTNILVCYGNDCWNFNAAEFGLGLAAFGAGLWGFVGKLVGRTITSDKQDGGLGNTMDGFEFIDIGGDLFRKEGNQTGN